MTELAEDGRWHMSLTGLARGFHLRYVKVENFDVLPRRVAVIVAPSRRPDVVFDVVPSDPIAVIVAPSLRPAASGGRSSKTTSKPRPRAVDEALLANAADEIPMLHMINLPKRGHGGLPAIEHPGLFSTRFFRNAHHMLCEFDETKDFETAVDLEDDPTGTLFEEIYTAWKAVGGSAAPCCVATCEEAGLLGVGFGWSKAYRVKAAKLSLAVAVGIQNNKLQTIAANGNYLDIRNMLIAAGLYRRIEQSV